MQDALLKNISIKSIDGMAMGKKFQRTSTSPYLKTLQIANI
jgi:hypothetical protein